VASFSENTQLHPESSATTTRPTFRGVLSSPPLADAVRLRSGILWYTNVQVPQLRSPGIRVGARIEYSVNIGFEDP